VTVRIDYSNFKSKVARGEPVRRSLGDETHQREGLF
jgi:hypothetical protein